MDLFALSAAQLNHNTVGNLYETLHNFRISFVMFCTHKWQTFSALCLVLLIKFPKLGQ